MLGDFIRLADYVAVEALVNLTVRTNEMFLTELLKPRKAGLFETTVLFTDEGTAFAPTCDEIKVRVRGEGWFRRCKWTLAGTGHANKLILKRSINISPPDLLARCLRRWAQKASPSVHASISSHLLPHPV